MPHSGVNHQKKFSPTRFFFYLSMTSQKFVGGAFWIRRNRQAVVTLRYLAQNAKTYDTY